MSDPLFRKDIEPRCAYCALSRPLDQDNVLCRKKGPMAVTESCRAFRYDPLRRVPTKPATLKTNFTAADFALEEEDT
ncbi:MAG: hypothetical protein IJ452_00700 [Butyricicoccus sp.]|nr:hypothetical protein [Butyricicoccus sp.]